MKSSGPNFVSGENGTHKFKPLTLQSIQMMGRLVPADEIGAQQVNRVGSRVNNHGIRRAYQRLPKQVDRCHRPQQEPNSKRQTGQHNGGKRNDQSPPTLLDCVCGFRPLDVEAACGEIPVLAPPLPDCSGAGLTDAEAGRVAYSLNEAKYEPGLISMRTAERLPSPT